jgi:hypothetical protein
MEFRTRLWSAATVSYLMSMAGLAAAAPPPAVRIYDHDRHDLTVGAKLEPGRVQHTVTLAKPLLIQNGVRHAEYNLTSSDGRQFTAVHHMEDGRDGVTGHIEARDVKSGKTVRWQIYPDRFQQVCHDGSTIDVTAENEGRQVYMAHSGGQVMGLDYDAAKTPEERERLRMAGVIVTRNWCQMDDAHRVALAAAHHTGHMDFGTADKNAFTHFFTHDIPSFFSTQVCGLPTGAKAALCGVGAAGAGVVAGLLTAKIISAAGARPKPKLVKGVGTGVAVAAFGGCGDAFTHCH